MLYNHERNLKATEERIRNSSISEANKQHIFDFESYCFAEGLKIARVLKHLIELEVLAEMIGQDFKSISKQDMMMLVGCIERMEREERTKQDYKSLIRKFFRWLERGKRALEYLQNEHSRCKIVLNMKKTLLHFKNQYTKHKSYLFY
ncbi:MAG: hypothetical protein ABOK23_12225 [Candidatus Methanoperedens sp.]|nr:hypothetical protein [Candidatus Methanoperedens sp.]